MNVETPETVQLAVECGAWQDQSEEDADSKYT